MAIALTLRQHQDVYVGDSQVILKHIESQNFAVLQFQGDSYEVSPLEWVSLRSGCQVRIGAPRENWPGRYRHEIRIQFEAPDFLVLRGSSYRNKREESL